MNNWNGIGRFTKDPVVRYTQKELAVAAFTIAIARGKENEPVDYIPCKAIGKTAELIEKYMTKGCLVGINGAIQTGSYEKDGHRVYTTEVLVNRIDFLSRPKQEQKPQEQKPEVYEPTMPEGFSMLDEDIPFE